MCGSTAAEKYPLHFTQGLGYNNEEMINIFFETNKFTLTAEKCLFHIVPERMRGEIAAFDIKHKDQILVEEGRELLQAYS